MNEDLHKKIEELEKENQALKAALAVAEDTLEGQKKMLRNSLDILTEIVEELSWELSAKEVI